MNSKRKGRENIVRSEMENRRMGQTRYIREREEYRR